VAVVHADDVYGDGLDKELASLLTFNGGPPPNDPQVFIDTDYGNPDQPGNTNPDQKFADAVNAVITLAPNIVIVLGYTPAVKQLIPEIETNWSSGPRPQYLLSNGMEVKELLTLLSANDDLRKRVLGTAPGANPAGNPALSKFAVRYRTTFKDGGTFPESYAVPNAFDAFYVAAYGIAVTRNSDLVGSDVTAGIKKILKPTPDAGVVDIGPDGIANALKAITAGQSFTFRGVSGPLAFDLTTGDVVSDVQIWCAVHKTTELAFEVTGLAYNATTQKLEGTIDSACTQ
jgi:ABC-type branched-subunit amino acid transport system substrate-binding protein